jgi:hypothetical protein
MKRPASAEPASAELGAPALRAAGGRPVMAPALRRGADWMSGGDAGQDGRFITLGRGENASLRAAADGEWGRAIGCVGGSGRIWDKPSRRLPLSTFLAAAGYPDTVAPEDLLCSSERPQRLGRPCC